MDERIRSKQTFDFIIVGGEFGLAFRSHLLRISKLEQVGRQEMLLQVV
jgi:hypothetical protein